MKEIRDSATVHGVELTIEMEAPPPEVDKGHYLVKPAERFLGCYASVSGLGTEASEYSRFAPA
jgi:hypothetical protein